MNARIAPPPIWPGPKTLNGRTETVGRPSSSWYACAMCSPASFETAYVQRASPTEPIVVTLPSSTLKACVPKHLARRRSRRAARACPVVAQRRLERVVRADHVDAHRPHRALEHRVDAGDRRRSGRCASRLARASVERSGVEHVALDEAEVRMVGERRAAERVAVEVVERDDLVLVDEPPRERRADEACAAGHDDALARQSHAASLRATDFGPRGRNDLTKTIATSVATLSQRHRHLLRPASVPVEARTRVERERRRARAPRAAVAPVRSALRSRTR